MRDRLFAAARLAAPATVTDRMPTPPDADQSERASSGPRRTSPAEPLILLAPRAVLKSLFSFEALLVLQMFAGIYKSDPRFAWIPIDPTGVFFALSVVVGSLIIVRNPIYKMGLPVVFAMVCLVVWLWVSLMWSPSRIYGPDKVFLMSTLVLWPLIAGALIIAPDPERVRRLFTLMLLFSLGGGADAVLAYAKSGGAVYSVTTFEGEDDNKYLALGRVCGPGALVALAVWLYSRGRVTGWLYLGLFFALAFVLAIGGGRGPLISTALPLLIPIGLGVRFTTRKIRYSRTLLSVLVLLLATAGGLALYPTLTGQRLATFDRLERLVEGNPRTELYGKTSEFWARAPLLGHGAGSWPLLAGYGDERNYPHNLFLELLVESGLVGLILFLALLAVAFRPASLERLRQGPQALCATMLFTNTLLNAMTTGDLPHNRGVFMMLGVLALFAIRPAGATAASRARRQPAAALDLSMARRRQTAATSASGPHDAVTAE